jgi:hypothetical protein
MNIFTKYSQDGKDEDEMGRVHGTHVANMKLIQNFAWKMSWKETSWEIQVQV